MDHFEQALRDDLHGAALAIEPGPSAEQAYRRVRRRARLRRSGTRSLVTAGLTAILAAAVVGPRYLAPEEPFGGQAGSGSTAGQGRGPTTTGGTTLRGTTPRADIPLLATDTRSVIDYRAEPAAGPAGTAIRISGSGCRPRAGDTAVDAQLLLTGHLNGQSESFTVRRDGTFEGSIKVWSPTLPNVYQVVVFCMAEGGQAQQGHEPRVGFGKTFTVTAPPAGASAGEPDAGGFTASLRRGGDGELLLDASGTGCFLRQAAGVAGGLGMVAVTRPGERFDGDALDFGLLSADAKVADDGSWTFKGLRVDRIMAFATPSPTPSKEQLSTPEQREALRRGAEQPLSGPFEVRAVCLDAQRVPGFAYQRVYRLDTDAARLDETG